VETQFGRLEVTEGILTSPGEITHGCIVHFGARDGVRSPERISRANGTASQRSVLPRSPACFGIKDGATTPQTCPLLVR
jgi:hypothetical protein